MKFTLAFLLCSYVAETCLPPHIWETQFDTEYDCLIEGYSQSLLKIQEIGPDDINTHRMYIKFGCYEEMKKYNYEKPYNTNNIITITIWLYDSGSISRINSD